MVKDVKIKPDTKIKLEVDENVTSVENNNDLSEPLLNKVEDGIKNEAKENEAIAETPASVFVNDEDPEPWSPTGNGWHDFLHFVGPGWLVCIAYVDPGNYQSDIFSGATAKYNLVFVLWWITIFSIYVQALSVRLGLYSQATLAEVQANDNPKYLKIFNWVIAEICVILADLPQVIGCGIAFNVFFGWPYYVGILLSIFTTILFLSTLQFGIDKLELIVIFFIGLMSICLFVEMGFVHAKFGEIMRGWAIGFVDLKGNQATAITGLLGSIVAPHNLYLHSATLQSTRVKRNETSVRAAVKYGSLEPIFPIILTFFINLACISIAAERVFGKPGAKNVGLTDFCHFFKTLPGGCVLWGLSLLAAAQSSAITVTYAGQFVLDGFLDIQLSVPTRAILSRVVAIGPCIIISVIFPDKLNTIVNITNSVISLLLPFALVPLIKYNCSEVYMGKYAAKGAEKYILYILGLGIYLLNAWALSSSGSPIFGFVPGMKVGVLKVFLIILEIIVQILYLSWILYTITSPVRAPMRRLEDPRPLDPSFSTSHTFM